MLKQDRLSHLEKQLEDVDMNETRDLLLGSCGLDGNAQRGNILSEIDTALAEYGVAVQRAQSRLVLMRFADALVERNHQMLCFEAAKSRFGPPKLG